MKEFCKRQSPVSRTIDGKSSSGQAPLARILQQYAKPLLPSGARGSVQGPIQRFVNPFQGFTYNNVEKPYSSDNEFTLHHMVPGNKIVTLFSAMAKNELKIAFMNTLYDVMRYYKNSSSSVTDTSEVANLFDEMRRNTERPELLEFPLLEKLWKYIIWYPPNLVQGPQSLIRKNDPGDKYDTQAAESIGIAPDTAVANKEKIDKLKEDSPISDIGAASSIYRHAPVPGGGKPHIPRYGDRFEVVSLEELRDAFSPLNSRYTSSPSVTFDQKRSDADECSKIQTSLTRLRSFYVQQANSLVSEADTLLGEVRGLGTKIQTASIVVSDSTSGTTDPDLGFNWEDLFAEDKSGTKTDSADTNQE